MEIRQIGGIEYALTRKRVKNINMRIHADGTVAVSAPSYISAGKVDEFVLSKSDFIENARKKLSVIEPHEPREYVNGEKYMLFGKEITLDISVGDANAYLDGDILRVSLINAHSYALRRSAVNAFFTRQCNTLFKELVDRYFTEFEPYGIAYPALKIRNMKSRWGSCIPSKGTITLNRQLIATPMECIEYVVVHEYCHFLEANHSKRFYAHVERHMPDWRERKNKLDKCSVNAV